MHVGAGWLVVGGWYLVPMVDTAGGMKLLGLNWAVYRGP